jgi:hypothetical protein
MTRNKDLAMFAQLMHGLSRMDNKKTVRRRIVLRTGRFSRLIEIKLHRKMPADQEFAEHKKLPTRVVFDDISEAGMIGVDRLSNIIRIVDGENKLGAGALAERIIESLAQSSEGEP